ncbi:MAG: hypothetical protein GYB64_12780 [Chloroflexi bacterium]|nr:hypothetical protein [Chloroflexota bacterium]
MQIQTILNILWRRGWIMILLAVLTAGAAYVFSTIMEQRAPVYKSSIRIGVEPARTDFGQAQAAQQLLRYYTEWMYSNYRAQEVIERLDLDMTPDQLRSDVTIASENSRLVIQIDVENRNGDLANDIAREWALLFVEWRNQENAQVRREDRIDAVILDDPRYGLAFPNTTINTAAGAVLGLLVGVAIVLVLEYIESGIIRSTEDVDRFLEMPVLGTIPRTEG